MENVFDKYAKEGLNLQFKYKLHIHQSPASHKLSNSKSLLMLVRYYFLDINVRCNTTSHPLP